MRDNNDERHTMAFRIGNTSIQIRDDYCRDKSKVEVEAILKRISTNIILSLSQEREI